MVSILCRRSAIVAIALLLSACSFMGSNGYYENDGPPTIDKSSSTTGVTPKIEPFYKASLRPYTVLGKRYVPVATDQPMAQEGIGSWYGKQFHGNKTSIGEIYDMYAVTAAHPTMPLPSYARVTNLENGRSIIVRVNDRGPFLHNRIIDLSYAAANMLDYAKKGTARLRVERLTNTQIASGAWRMPGSSTVEVEEVKPVTNTSISTTKPVASGWGAQIGNFDQEANAVHFAAHAEAVLAGTGRAMPVRIVRDAGRYRVIVGSGMSLETARAVAADTGVRLGVGAFAIRK